MMVNNTSAPTATSSITTTQCHPAVSPAPHHNDTSCTSSNSGASSGAYRRNPYNAVQPLVYYGNSANSSTHQSPSPQQNQQQYPEASYYPQQQQQEYYSPEEYNNNEASLQYNDQYLSFEQQRFLAATPVMTHRPPQGTLHQQLAGRVNFALYPTVAFESLEPALPKHQMVRMFIGQLPYHVTEMQLSWILYAFGAGANMYHFERITKTDHSKGGIKVPTGCFHCHMEAEQVAPLLKFLNDRLLVDDTGIWVTETAEERQMLSRYCHGMKVDKTRRFQGRPYGTVVAQVATSTFDPDTFAPARFAGGFHRHQ